MTEPKNTIDLAQFEDRALHEAADWLGYLLDRDVTYSLGRWLLRVLGNEVHRRSLDEPTVSAPVDLTQVLDRPASELVHAVDIALRIRSASGKDFGDLTLKLEATFMAAVHLAVTKLEKRNEHLEQSQKAVLLSQCHAIAIETGDYETAVQLAITQPSGEVEDVKPKRDGMDR